MIKIHPHLTPRRRMIYLWAGLPAKLLPPFTLPAFAVVCELCRLYGCWDSSMIDSLSSLSTPHKMSIQLYYMTIIFKLMLEIN